MPTIQLGQLAKKAKCPQKTVDHYVRRGLIPFTTGENGYRLFDEEDALARVGLIRAMLRRPINRDIEDIKKLFSNASIADLQAQHRSSTKQLFRFLVDKGLI